MLFNNMDKMGYNAYSLTWTVLKNPEIESLRKNWISMYGKSLHTGFYHTLWYWRKIAQ